MTPSPRRCPGERARPAGKRAQATADRCVYDIRAHVRSSQGDVRRLAVHLEFVQSGGREEYPPRRSTSARGCGQILEQGGERRASRSLGRILRETLGAEDKKGVSSRASQPAKRQGSQMERHAWRSGASRRWSSAPMCRSGSPSPVLRAPRTWPAIRGRPFTSCQRRTGHRAPPTTFRYYTDMVEDLGEGGDAAFTGRGRPPRSQQLANRPAPPGGGDGRRRRRIPGWWRRGDSNPRPPACKAGALPLSYVPTPHREGVHPQFTIAASSLEKECPLRLRPSLAPERVSTSASPSEVSR
jgi:hypothetical protein